MRRYILRDVWLEGGVSNNIQLAPELRASLRAQIHNLPIILAPPDATVSDPPSAAQIGSVHLGDDDVLYADLFDETLTPEFVAGCRPALCFDSPTPPPDESAAQPQIIHAARLRYIYLVPKTADDLGGFDLPPA